MELRSVRSSEISSGHAAVAMTERPKQPAPRAEPLLDSARREALLKRCLAAARQLLYVRCYLETVKQMQPALRFYGRHGFQDLKWPLGETGHRHNDRWMIRPLRASARQWVGMSMGV